MDKIVKDSSAFRMFLLLLFRFFCVIKEETMFEKYTLHARRGYCILFQLDVYHFVFACDCVCLYVREDSKLTFLLLRAKLIRTQRNISRVIDR